MAYLQQIRELLLRLTMRQRILIGTVAVLVIGGIWGLIHWQTERNFKTLFQDLSAEDAGVVLARLKESNSEVRLENGGKTIKVPAEKVDELRIQMASAGLPKSGRIGFELFDKPNFGTSEFAEQVNYHRAVEGELERSVMALQEVESSRVHITFPRQSLFLENRQPAKASVLLKLKPGADISRQNVQAIAHLASSAVDGLAPENVSVLDMRGNLLSRPKKAGEGDDESPKELIEYRERMEKDLLQKIKATLDPLVGPDGFRAAISLDCDIASGDQSEETFDPSRSVMLNSQRSEEGSTPPAANGVPGTPSNLPRPSSRPGSAGGNPLFRRSESTAFQTSRVIRHTRFPHGQVKRLSASVLLDHIVKTEGGRQTVEAPAPERLRAIKDLVSATVGFQQERGDQIIVEALPFETTRNLSPLPGTVATVPTRPRLQLPNTIPGWLRVPLEGHLNWLVERSWLPPIIIVLLLGVLYGLYRILRGVGRKATGLIAAVSSKLPFLQKKGQLIDVTMEPALEGSAEAARLEAGRTAVEGVSKSLDEQLREREKLREKMTNDALLELEIPKTEVRRGEILTRHLSDLATKDPEGVANLIRTWTEGKGFY